jgi:DNA-binding response OmpR family regulator
MRILIAEDDVTTRMVLGVVVEKMGHQPVTVTSGLEAWAALQSPDAPRLAVVDWMMPGIDGLELCRRVRARETDEPLYVLMLTTKRDKADIIAGLAAGADDYLVKPFDPGELRARLEVGRRFVDLHARVAEERRQLREALERIKALEGTMPGCLP